MEPLHSLHKKGCFCLGQMEASSIEDTPSDIDHLWKDINMLSWLDRSGQCSNFNSSFDAAMELAYGYVTGTYHTA